MDFIIMMFKLLLYNQGIGFSCNCFPSHKIAGRPDFGEPPWNLPAPSSEMSAATVSAMAYAIKIVMSGAAVSDEHSLTK